MKQVKKRIFEIIQIGNKQDLASAAFDVFISVLILVNLFITLFSTYDSYAKYAGILGIVELITILIFAAEYVLRIWTANYLYPEEKNAKAVFKFVFSLYGLIDLMTILPYFLPFVFPAGAVAFRMLRVIRIFRLFRVNSQYDAFNVIVDVLNEKKNQIFSSVFLVMILMVASSLCMYSLEHEAQPDQFANAFSGIWWSMSTLLTVGYGDIYPVTMAGKVMAIVIAFLGVGMVAIPTGIISAGFVEHYSRAKRTANYIEEMELQFIVCDLLDKHAWIGKKLSDVMLPPGQIVVMVLRGKRTIVPNGETVFEDGDKVVFGAKNYKYESEMNLREVIVKDEHEWVDKMVKDLDISRLDMIVMIRRGEKVIIPKGDTMILSGDALIIYTQIR